MDYASRVGARKTGAMVLASALVVTGLAGCGNKTLRQTLRLSGIAPDEFVVAPLAPLELPPGLTLPPPRPGAKRPQGDSAEVEARRAALGTGGGARESRGLTSGERGLLGLVREAVESGGGGRDDARLEGGLKAARAPLGTLSGSEGRYAASLKEEEGLSGLEERLTNPIAEGG